MTKKDWVAVAVAVMTMLLIGGGKILCK
jgi:hypothetical protein